MIKVYNNEKDLSKNLALEILTKLKNKKKTCTGMSRRTLIKKNILLFRNIIFQAQNQFRQAYFGNDG